MPAGLDLFLSPAAWPWTWVCRAAPWQASGPSYLSSAPAGEACWHLYLLEMQSRGSRTIRSGRRHPLICLEGVSGRAFARSHRSGGLCGLLLGAYMALCWHASSPELRGLRWTRAPALGVQRSARPLAYIRGIARIAAPNPGAAQLGGHKTTHQAEQCSPRKQEPQQHGARAPPSALRRQLHGRSRCCCVTRHTQGPCS